MRSSNMNKVNKTNAARLLDRAGVRYELIPYEVDENDLAAGHIAAQLSEPLEQVFKTLVLSGDRTGYFCVCRARGFGGGPEVGGESVREQEM